MDSDVIARIADGAVVVLPTDTVYGLVCSAKLPEAIARLYRLKDRENKPGTLVAASIEQLVELGIPRRYLKPVEHYWPNAITIVVPAGAIPTAIHQGKGSIAVRIPKDTAFHELLQHTGPLLTSSANQPGEQPAETVAQAEAYFGDSVDLYVDGGDLSGRQASTIIRIVDDAVEILREGAVKISESGEIVDEIE